MEKRRPSTEILFARHGESAANAEGYLAGQLDVRLTPKGERQAVETGQQLLATGKVPDLIVTSPLKRARKTAELIADQVGYQGEIVQMHELAERDGGDLQGNPIQRFYEATDEEIVAAGGESLDDFADRLRRAGTILGVMALGKTVLVVGHAEAYRMATANVEGKKPGEYLEVEKPENAQVYEYPMTPEDKSNREKMTKILHSGRKRRWPILLR